MGFDTLQEVLEMSILIGVKEITVFAFSIENFKRPPQEVEGLMELAKEKLTKMMEENDLIDKLEICVRIAGDLSLVPPDVREVMEKTVNYSRRHSKAILNLCFSYTSREEMVHSIRCLGEAVHNNILKSSDIKEEHFEGGLYVSNPPDIVVRTSGEIRLSDFLLWQSSFSCLMFMPVLWPDFSMWSFLKTIFMYQYKYNMMQDRRKYASTMQKEYPSQVLNKNGCNHNHSGYNNHHNNNYHNNTYSNHTDNKINGIQHNNIINSKKDL